MSICCLIYANNEQVGGHNVLPGWYLLSTRDPMSSLSRLGVIPSESDRSGLGSECWQRWIDGKHYGNPVRAPVYSV